MSYEWIIIGQLSECVIPGQKDKKKLVDKSETGDSVDQDVRLQGVRNWKRLY
jgi:hypothetical protein